MADKTSRAMRRHHRLRMQIHTRNLLLMQFSGPRDQEWIEKSIYKMYDNFTTCSCWMCCNQRHNPFLSKEERLTMQERKANESFLTEIKDLDI